MPILVDTDILGYTPSDSTTRKVYDGDALTNALKLFLFSDAGDYIGQPGKGGFLLRKLMKPMREVDAQDIHVAISLALESFRPALQVYQLFVFPNTEKLRWEITFTYVVPSLKLAGSFSEQLTGRL